MKQQEQTNVELSQEELQAVTGGNVSYQGLGPKTGLTGGSVSYQGIGPETGLTIGGVTMERNGHLTKAGIAWDRNVGRDNDVARIN